MHELAASGSTPRANILVVDDHQDKVLVLQTILEDLNENVVVASSGKEALKLMLEMEFAVILLDVKMPEMDGFETAALIRGRRKFAHTPIIFVTAYAEEMHTSEGYSLGAVDYILTPIVPDVLRTKVSVFVQLFHMTNRIKQQAEERVILVREQTARAAAEEAIRRSTFLADASHVLSKSLAVEETLTGLTRFVVPFLGDLCAIVQFDDAGGVRNTQLAWTAGRGGPVNIQQATVVRLCDEKIAAGLARSLTRTDVELLELESEQIALAADSGGGSPDLLALGFALGKLAIFPLVARGRQLGALLCGVSTSRSFSSADLAIASDLAGRTAIALDNGLLYSRIQSADQRKDEFLAMLAHELRNPLAPIRSAVAVMHRVGSQTPLMMWSRDVIERQVAHLTRLVDDLLDVSRLTQGKIRLERQSVDLGSVIERALEVSRPSIDSHKHRLQVMLPETPVYLDGDPVRLAQVFSNLLNNAAKFTPEEGRISVIAELAANRVRVRIQDNGCGMPADLLPHAFDLFTQANRSLARSEGGLGIGLTLVRTLVQKHGGSVGAHSDGPGKGSEFIVELPVVQRKSRVTSTKRDDRTVQPPALRILLIDDNSDANATLATLLGLCGQEVRTALDGPTALLVAAEFRPQLVFCDLGLPGMDGYEVLRLLRAQAADPMPAIIALTGYGRAEDQKLTSEAGFDGHLVKPVDFERLQELIVAQTQNGPGSLAVAAEASRRLS
ncbi:MAG TPA: response regulator [Burkholderiales bacterium]|nr:response regulator [Burkholderiales bacterium]